MRSIFLSISITVLSGCASTSGSGMNGIMSSWVGTDIDRAVAQWGYPHEQRKFDEITFYVWHHNKSGFTPATENRITDLHGSVSATYTTSGAYEVHGSCDRILEVDDNNIVIKWEWRGNKCPLIESMEYSQWRNKTGLE